MITPRQVTLAIIGGGPAGMAAARAAEEVAIDTVMLDEGAEDGALVWFVDRDGTICYSPASGAEKLIAQYIILAPGVQKSWAVDDHENPDIQITSALGLAHAWDPVQGFWYPQCGEDGRTALERVFLAGAVTGRFGIAMAAWQGWRAALAVARDLGKDIGNVDLAEPPVPEAQTSLSFDVATLDDDAIACPCEEVTAGDIRRLGALGCREVNQAKALGRPGAGPCQGRRCALLVAAVLADARGVGMAEVGYFRQRWPTSPVSLDQLSKFADEDG